MKHSGKMAAAIAILAVGCGRHTTVEVSGSADLAAAIATAPDRATIRIGPGDYEVRGLTVMGKSLNLIGAGKVATKLVSPGGEGILFEQTGYSALQDLTIVGAGVAVRGGQLTVASVRISGGITGIAAHERSRLIIRNSEIMDSTRDGISLEGGAEAVVEHCLVDGVDGGGGAAIGAAAGSRLSLLNTVVRRFQEGIRLSERTGAEIHGNVIEEIRDRGLSLSEGVNVRADDNVIYKTGGCGALDPAGGAGSGSGRLAGNVLVETASGPSCIDASAEPPIGKLCRNLSALPFGTATSFYSRFCYDASLSLGETQPT